MECDGYDREDSERRAPKPEIVCAPHRSALSAVTSSARLFQWQSQARRFERRQVAAPTASATSASEVGSGTAAAKTNVPASNRFTGPPPGFVGKTSGTVP